MIKFPTTLVFIDDHKEFLEGLKVLLEPMHNSMVFFSNPLEALDFINSDDSLQVHQGDFWESYDESPENDNDSLARLKHSHTRNIIKNPKRFRQLSCVISDFDMMEMDGIELFSKITHPHIRKILLTGVASHEYGITAFNSGSINQFLQKDNPFLYQILQPTIQDQEKSFFMNFNFQQRENRGLEELLKAFEKEKTIVEKYCIDPLGSKLLINNKGEQWVLGVFSEEALSSQLTQARDFNAPQTVIDVLEQKKKAFSFYSLNNEAPIPEVSVWENHMHPIDYVQADDVYYSLFKVKAPEKVTNFQDYLSSEKES